jgi:uncharacterized protein (TIGR00251 family)
LTLRVKVIPRSTSNEIAGQLADGTLKIKIAAPPEKGRANEALVDLLAETYHVSRAAIEIVSGHTAKVKLVRINLPGERAGRATR